MDAHEVKIEKSWKKILGTELREKYFADLANFVKTEIKNTKVFPHPKNIFRAFELTPFDSVRVVILGQDPYHGEGQAHGLSFSVSENTPLPPSLQNIFKEVSSDLGLPFEALAKKGDLSRWAEQGVLLLNAVLTVRANSPASHKGRGWENFTDAVIKILSDKKENLVFILWGNYAREKGKVIDRTRHLVIESPHPSPFSAHSGFFGSRPFSRTNTYLKSKNLPKIDWR